MQIYKIKTIPQKIFANRWLKPSVFPFFQPFVAASRVCTSVFRLFADAFVDGFPGIIPSIDASQYADRPAYKPRHNAGQEPFLGHSSFGFCATDGTFFHGGCFYTSLNLNRQVLVSSFHLWLIIFKFFYRIT